MAKLFEEIPIASAREFFTQLGIDTNHLYLLTLEEYEAGLNDTLQTHIPLRGTASHLSARVSNIVLTPSIKPADGPLPIEKCYDNLSDYGFYCNSKKFHSIYITYDDRVMGCKITIYPGGSVDCKGAGKLFHVYAALEYTFHLLRKHVYDNRYDAFTVERCPVSNIVVTCVFDFVLPVEALVDLHPFVCTAMHEPGKRKRRISAAQFKGANYTLVLPDGTQMSFGFQKHRTVNCVGCTKYEQAQLGLEQFYEIAKAARRHTPALSLRNARHAISNHPNKGKQRQNS